MCVCCCRCCCCCCHQSRLLRGSHLQTCTRGCVCICRLPGISIRLVHCVNQRVSGVHLSLSLPLLSWSDCHSTATISASLLSAHCRPAAQSPEPPTSRASLACTNIAARATAHLACCRVLACGCSAHQCCRQAAAMCREITDAECVAPIVSTACVWRVCVSRSARLACVWGVCLCTCASSAQGAVLCCAVPGQQTFRHMPGVPSRATSVPCMHACVCVCVSPWLWFVSVGVHGAAQAPPSLFEQLHAGCGWGARRAGFAVLCSL